MYVNMKKEFLGDITTTKDIIIPKDPLERVIGHDDIIKFVKIAAKQRRNPRPLRISLNRVSWICQLVEQASLPVISSGIFLHVSRLSPDGRRPQS